MGGPGDVRSSKQRVPEKQAVSNESNAFIDESGQRAFTRKASDFFVMSAVIFDGLGLDQSTDLLAEIRRDLGRGPSDVLHWKQIKTHSQRLRAVQLIARSSFVTVSAVVVSKRRLNFPNPYWAPTNNDQTYLNTVGMLLKRLSWMSSERGRVMSYTLAHVVRFKIATLRRYEAALRASTYEIEWASLNPNGGAIDRPANCGPLQLADIAASAVAAAFEPDRFGNLETRYLVELGPKLYRRTGWPLTVSGLKLFPQLGEEETRATFPWLGVLS